MEHLNKVVEAIEVINEYLDQEWISEACREYHSFGCASCSAKLLKKQLDGIANNLRKPSPAT